MHRDSEQSTRSDRELLRAFGEPPVKDVDLDMPVMQDGVGQPSMHMGAIRCHSSSCIATEPVRKK